MNEEISLDMHRSIDELGKFSVEMEIWPNEPLDGKAAEALLRAIMIDSTQACMDGGADLVGHVKAFLADKEGGGTINANLIDLDLEMTLNNDMPGGLGDGMLTLHIIVHGIWDPEVRRIAMSVIDDIMARHGIGYNVRYDYYEKEKRVE